MARSRLPISYRQLCLIARDEITKAPTIDDVEWKERVKDRCFATGFQTPTSGPLHRALTGVEQALRKATPRPPDPWLTPRAPRAREIPEVPERRWRVIPRQKGDGWTSIRQLLQNVKPSSTD